MRKSIAVILVALAGTLATPAFAITGNWVDDNQHPFVGLVVFYNSSGQFLWRCSGSLISPTKFVTAGHCADTAEGAASARVYFQQDAGKNFDPATGVDPVSGYPNTCAPGTLGVVCATSSQLFNYGFANFAGFPNTRDVGLVILDQPIATAGVRPAAAGGCAQRARQGARQKGHDLHCQRIRAEPERERAFRALKYLVSCPPHGAIHAG